MRDGSDDLVGRLDRLGVQRAAQAAGLPAPLAARVADVVVSSGLPEDRREEVFRELVAHFEDGLAAGRRVDELLAAFGDGRRAARLIGQEKRIVTSETMGGSGAREGLLRRLGQDARYAVRRLAARPAFTLTAILSLALGIGANAGIFTLINDVIFRRPPLAEPERLIDIYGSSQAFPFTPITYPEVLDLARRTDVFEGVVGSRLGFANRTDQDRPDRLFVQLVSGDFFGLLGVRTVVGRAIEPADASAPGVGMVAVLSDRYWRRAFGADRGVVGRSLPLGDGAYTIVGVAPPGFEGGLRGIGTDIYVPITRINHLMPSGVDELTTRSNHSVFAKARLRPGVTLPRARAAVDAVAADLRAQRLPGWDGTQAFTVIPTAEVILYPPVDKMLAPMAAMLMVVVGLVLVIACANLAGFLLARAVDRKKEIAIRLSLGATRSRLVSQLLVETMLLALLGGLAGIGLGKVGLKALLASDLPFPVPISLDLPLDGTVLLFSIGVSLLAGVLAGLAPALQSTRLELASVIRDESTGGGRSKGVLRSALVSGQVGVAVVLLVVAGLFLRSLVAIRQVDPGFGARPTALIWLQTSARLDSAGSRLQYEGLKRTLGALPGVVAIGGTGNLHLNQLSTSSTEIMVDGVEPPPGEPAHSVDHATIDTGYVGAVGLRVTRGRNLTYPDVEQGRRVALVNEAFVDRFWPGLDPIGRRFRNRQGEETEVVGVVATAKIRSLAESPRPFVYEATDQRRFNDGWLVVVGTGNDDALLAATLRAARTEARDLMVLEARTMRRHLAMMALPVRFAATALAGFALLAVVMACVGLYGTVSYAVAQRSREVGIRLSLGADRGGVVRLLMWGGLRLALAGAGFGLVVGALFGRVLEGLLVGIRGFDPLTLTVVPLLLLGVTALAAWVPARRAGRIDPVVALKSE